VLDGVFDELDLEPLVDSELLVGAGVTAAGALLVVSDVVAGLEDSEDEESDVEVEDGDAVALAPRLSFL
jgi:hypothetical protein